MKPLTVTVTHLDKFCKLMENWEKVYLGGYHCKLHDTYFDGAEEPCWQCWNACTEIKVKNYENTLAEMKEAESFQRE